MARWLLDAAAAIAADEANAREIRAKAAGRNCPFVRAVRAKHMIDYPESYLPGGGKPHWFDFDGSIINEE